jgi:hypothetical protein
MFGGLMPAMVTPFDERGELDLRATEAVVERFIEAGVSGISPLGSTGEATHLTFEERNRFAEEVVRIVGGRLPLVVGVGTSGMRETVELARHAEGADAGLWSSRLLLEGGRGGPVPALRDRGRVGRHPGRYIQPPHAYRRGPLARPDRADSRRVCERRRDQVYRSLVSKLLRGLNCASTPHYSTERKGCI